MPRILALGLCLMIGLASLVSAGRPAAAEETFTAQEIVDTGNKFFGTVTSGFASVIEKAISSYGQPNGYILGQEGSGAIVGGVRYGEGVLYTRNAGQLKVYWQGPSIGFDFGADGARTMILVYNLQTVQDVFRRFGGVDGSAYIVGGFGLTALTDGGVTMVPVRSGVGARLGLNVGYLKFTDAPTWNPF